ncbi:MAG: Gfo/Idh/MocA family oxidoreductase [Acidobacteria bacterium]|nr:Gfo/Idh/MocA family oxidoreductase [Acidobacteriota bacterium]
MAEVNIALIGYKFMGKAHSNAFRQVRRFFPGKLVPRLKVICGRDRAGLKAAAQQFGWEEIETDWEKVVRRKDIDIVDVSTPGHLHHSMVLAAARAKKHIICEKPLGNTLKEAREMLAAVKRAGVLHMLMFNYRRIPAIAYARKLMRSGKLGKIYHWHGAYLQDWIMDPEFPLVWRLDKKFAGTGALGDIGAHAIDFAQYLNGNITEVIGHSTTFIKRRPVATRQGRLKAKGGPEKGKVTVDDDTNFLARFRNGSVGVFESSRFCGGRRNYNTFQVYGSKGSLAFNLERLNELEIYNSEEPAGEQGFKTVSVTEAVHPYVGNWWPPGHIIGYEHTFVHAVKDFLDCLDKGRMPRPNFEDGIQNQAVLDAVERSAASRRWTEVTV